MALVRCPECGRENVSDQAYTCPDCGFPIKDFLAGQGDIRDPQAAVEAEPGPEAPEGQETVQEEQPAAAAQEGETAAPALELSEQQKQLISELFKRKSRGQMGILVGVILVFALVCVLIWCAVQTRFIIGLAAIIVLLLVFWAIHTILEALRELDYRVQLIAGDLDGYYKYLDWRKERKRDTKIKPKESKEHPVCPHCGSRDTKAISQFDLDLAASGEGPTDIIGKKYECLVCLAKW